MLLIFPSPYLAILGSRPTDLDSFEVSVVDPLINIKQFVFISCFIVFNVLMYTY